MQIEDLYALVTTDNLREARDFYVGHLNFTVAFEATWFVLLTAPGGRGLNVAFMSTGHPSAPPGPEPFDGRGVVLTLQVADAAAEYERLRARGVPFHHPLTDEPWGQRRFLLRDPAGVLLDVVQQTEPAPGFWEPYLPSASS
jgi:catechol 2,3-dioxygenase-like lactoylglutathione lyase family enzyme